MNVKAAQPKILIIGAREIVKLKVGVIILTLLENARMALRYDPLGRNYLKGNQQAQRTV